VYLGRDIFTKQLTLN